MFERCPVPTPFETGPVNAYLAERTVIDPGPRTDEAWEAIHSALADRGLEPEDVERVLLTHPHPDHFGLASRFRDRGAAVLASDAAAPICEDFAGRLEYEATFLGDLLPAHGMPAETAETVAELGQAILPYAADCPVDRTLRHGDEVEIGAATLGVERARGHAVGELVFTVDDDGAARAIVGDHVLPGTTPNPLLQPPETSGGDRPRVLPAYNESLERLRTRGFDAFLPGHGARIDRPVERIDAILDAHERRSDRVLTALESPATAYEVMHELFEDLPVAQQFGGMSEAIGHLDVLEARGAVVRRPTDEVIVYERSA